MEQLPLDARNIVEKLRTANLQHAGDGPRSWIPTSSFEALLEDAEVTPVALNDHLSWLHANCDLAQVLAPPEGSGVKTFVKRLVYRAVLAVLHPYLVKVQDCIAVSVRALDSVALRVDEQAAMQMRAVVAMRADLVDLAAQVEKRRDE
jgi:ABC-type uncharacterized transport system YnjBCD substrate-binding protein